MIAALSAGTAPISGAPIRNIWSRLTRWDPRGWETPPNGAHSLLGLAATLWPVIYRLSGLLAVKREVERLVAHGDATAAAELQATYHEECASVESALDVWHPVLPSAYDVDTFLGTPPSSSKLEAQQFRSIFNNALAYKHSALVYLYRTIYDSPTQHPVVQHHVSASLVHCEATVRHEGPRGALLWPLFVASCEAVDPTDRGLACATFCGLSQRQGMANISRAWDVVQEVWNRADEREGDGLESTSDTRTDQRDLWRKVSEEMGVTIVFG